MVSVIQEHTIQTNTLLIKILTVETVFLDSFACSCASFSPIGLPCLTFLWGLLLCLTVSCFVLFSCCLLKACSFLKRKWTESGSGGEWKVGRSGRSREKGSCGQDVLFERIYFQLKNTKQLLLFHKSNPLCRENCKMRFGGGRRSMSSRQRNCYPGLSVHSNSGHRKDTIGRMQATIDIKAQ